MPSDLDVTMSAYRRVDVCPVETAGGHTYVRNRRLAHLRQCEWVLDVLNRFAGSVDLKPSGQWRVTIWGCAASVASRRTLEECAERVAYVLRRGSTHRSPIDVPPCPLLEVPEGETPIPLARLNYLERCAEVAELLEQGMFYIAGGGGDLYPWWEVFPTEVYEDEDEGPPYECGEGSTLQSAVEEVMGWTHVPQVTGEQQHAEELWKLMGPTVEGLFLAGLLGGAICLFFWLFG